MVRSFASISNLNLGVRRVTCEPQRWPCRKNMVKRFFRTAAMRSCYAQLFWSGPYFVLSQGSAATLERLVFSTTKLEGLAKP
jgi:hypothetical protein